MKILLAVIALVALTLRLWNVGDVGISHWDAGSYTAGPYGIGPYGKSYILPFYAPPLLPSLTWAAFEVFGRVASVAAVLMALLGVAAVLAVYSLGRRLFGIGPALIGAAALASMSFHVVYSRQPLADAPYVLLFILAIQALWVGWHDGRRSAFLAAGVWTGACLLTKYHGFFPLVVFGLLVLAARVPGLVRPRAEIPGPMPTTLSGIKGLILAGAIVAIPAAWLAWDIGTHIGFDVFRANRQSWIPEMGLWLIPQTAAYVFECLSRWVGVALLVCAAGGYGVMIVRRHPGDVLMLLWTGLFLGTLPLYMNYPRLVLPLLVPLSLAAGVGLNALIQRLGGAGSLKATGIVVALVLVTGSLRTAPALGVADTGYEAAAEWLIDQGPGELPDLLVTQHAILFYLGDAPNTFLALDEPALAETLRTGAFRYLVADLRELQLPEALRESFDRRRPLLQQVATFANPLPEPFVVNLAGFEGLDALNDPDTSPERREALGTLRIWLNLRPDNR